MKKSILALSAAVALGGLGFASSANAIAYFGQPATVPMVGSANTPAPMAADLSLHAASTGHFLFQPYFTAQGSMGTLMTITNTDLRNGKAVKVRFRSATNSDDVLDFSLFLSPGDVWSAQVTKDAATGNAVISTPDSSCTIPVAADWPGVFRAERLPSFLDAEKLSQHTREGYVEILNMADIPPTIMSTGVGVNAGVAIKGANKLFAAIKHVAGKAPCTAGAFDGLLSTDVVAADVAEGHGLAAPTGSLMGTWSIFNQEALASYGGAQTAVIASPDAAPGPNGTLTTGYGLIAFAPQFGAEINDPAQVWATTADPLLRHGVAITPLWYDLPDMSTPLVGKYIGDPLLQAMDLSNTLTKDLVMNDYVATAAGAPVPMETDWVVSQPTRRYHAAMEYGTTAATSAIRWNIDLSDGSAADTTTTVKADVDAPVGGSRVTAGNSYNLLTQVNGDYGPQACLSGRLSTSDREEGQVSVGGGFSPGGTAAPYCGEVFTVQFGATSVLQAAVTRKAHTPLGQAGWGRLDLGSTGTVSLPIVGFAATSMKNQTTGGNFGITSPHRWSGTTQTTP